MRYELEIIGNQEDPKNGNPIPYERMTQRGKWKNKRAQRYLAWKKYVQECWLEKYGRLPKYDGSNSLQLDVACLFKGENHADPDNIYKAIADSLFKNDKHVWGRVCFAHVAQDPGVKITVQFAGGL